MEEDPIVSLRSVLREPDDPGWRRLATGRTPRLAVAVIVIATGVVLGAGIRPGQPTTGGAPPSTGGPHHRTVRPDSSTSTSTSTTAAVRLWPAVALTVEGRLVASDEGRWEVGVDGDVVAVGDWDCDRLPTPAVVRPSTGEVAVFDRWAGEAPESARSVATVDGATEVRATDRCGEVLVVRATGDEQVIATRPAAS